MKKTDSPPEAEPVRLGERFSHVYRKRGEAVSDSPRLRRRFSALVHDTYGLHEFERELEKELGVPVGNAGWHAFFVNCDLSDFLDAVTIAYRYLLKVVEIGDNYRFVHPKTWLDTVRRILAEENLHYTCLLYTSPSPRD